ncbi:hypothetical protein [Streptomyces sp. NPDC057325]|uniref:hypothetical protein n=1 Tax=unclassified Streptomyces TaxID=2593676 RepID=UPI003644D19A
MVSTRLRTALTYSASWGGVARCGFLCLEVPDGIRLGVLDARFMHGGLPAYVLLAGCFDLFETSEFGGFAGKRDLLHNLGELVFEGAARVSVHSLARCGWPPLRTKRSRSDGV